VAVYASNNFHRDGYNVSTVFIKKRIHLAYALVSPDAFEREHPLLANSPVLGISSLHAFLPRR